jgi:hypothetical protein
LLQTHEKAPITRGFFLVLQSVGAAEGCDLLMLLLKDQKIAAFGSSYR